jgi:hypothetical protein
MLLLLENRRRRDRLRRLVDVMDRRGQAMETGQDDRSISLLRGHERVVEALIELCHEDAVGTLEDGNARRISFTEPAGNCGNLIVDARVRRLLGWLLAVVRAAVGRLLRGGDAYGGEEDRKQRENAHSNSVHGSAP